MVIRPAHVLIESLWYCHATRVARNSQSVPTLSSQSVRRCCTTIHVSTSLDDLLALDLNLQARRPLSTRRPCVRCVMDGLCSLPPAHPLGALVSRALSRTRDTRCSSTIISRWRLHCQTASHHEAAILCNRHCTGGHCCTLGGIHFEFFVGSSLDALKTLLGGLFRRRRPQHSLRCRRPTRLQGVVCQVQPNTRRGAIPKL